MERALADQLRQDSNAPVLDPLAKYLQDAAVEEFLTRKEEEALTERMEKGDLDARNELIQAHLPMVLPHARRAAKGREDLQQDLIQEGNMALFRVARKFDRSMGVRFNYYANYWVRQAIGHEKHRRRKHLGLYEGKTQYSVSSLHATAREGGDAELGLFLEDKSAERPDAALEHVEEQVTNRQKLVDAMLRSTSKNQRNLMWRRLGLKGKPQTLDALGKSIHVTRERVRQRVETAERTMKEMGADMQYFGRGIVERLWELAGKNRQIPVAAQFGILDRTAEEPVTATTLTHPQHEDLLCRVHFHLSRLGDDPRANVIRMVYFSDPNVAHRSSKSVGMRLGLSANQVERECTAGLQYLCQQLRNDQPTIRLQVLNGTMQRNSMMEKIDAYRRVRTHQTAMAKRVLECMRNHLQRTGVEPTPQAIAADLDLPPDATPDAVLEHIRSRLEVTMSEYCSKGQTHVLARLHSFFGRLEPQKRSRIIRDLDSSKTAIATKETRGVRRIAQALSASWTMEKRTAMQRHLLTNMTLNLAGDDPAPEQIDTALAHLASRLNISADALKAWQDGDDHAAPVAEAMAKRVAETQRLNDHDRTILRDRYCVGEGAPDLPHSPKKIGRSIDVPNNKVSEWAFELGRKMRFVLEEPSLKETEQQRQELRVLVRYLISTPQEWLNITPKNRAKLKFGDLTLVGLARVFDVQGTPTKHTIDHVRLGLAIFGDEPFLQESLSRELDKERVEQELGTDTGKWSAEIRNCIPSKEAWMQMSHSERLKFQVRGKGIVALAGIFGIDDCPVRHNHAFAKLGMAVFGRSRMFENLIREHQAQEQMVKQLGADPKFWAMEIAKQYPTIEAWMNASYRDRRSINVAGKGIQSIAAIFGLTVNRSSREDVDIHRMLGERIFLVLQQ